MAPPAGQVVAPGGCSKPFALTENLDRASPPRADEFDRPGETQDAGQLAPGRIQHPHESVVTPRAGGSRMGYR